MLGRWGKGWQEWVAGCDPSASVGAAGPSALPFSPTHLEPALRALHAAPLAHPQHNPCLCTPPPHPLTHPLTLNPHCVSFTPPPATATTSRWKPCIRKLRSALRLAHAACSRWARLPTAMATGPRASAGRVLPVGGVEGGEGMGGEGLWIRKEGSKQGAHCC